MSNAQQTINDVAGAKPELADVNGDGYPDLVIVVKESDHYYAGVALNEQDGQFAASPNAPVTAVGGGANAGFETGDVTGDGHADLIAETAYDTSCPGDTPSLTTYVSNGQSGLRQGPTTCWPTSVGNHGIAAALQVVDLNGDLKADIAGYVPAGGSPPGQVYPAEVWTAIATGGGSFTTRVVDTFQSSWTNQQTIAASDGCPTTVTYTTCTVKSNQPAVWGDFDGDHRTDLAVLTENTAGSVVAHVLRSDGSGGFAPAQTWSTSLPKEALRTITTEWCPLRCMVPIDHTLKQADEILAGDFDGDGQTDLAAAAQTADRSGITSATRLLNTGLGGFNTAWTNNVSWSGRCGNGCNTPVLLAGDSNADGRDDIIAVHADQSSAALSSILSPPGPRLSGLLSADVNGDGLADHVSVAMSSDSTVEVRTYLATAAGDLHALAPVSVSVANAYLKHLPADQWQPADVNGDHLADLVNLPFGARYGVELIATPSHGWTEQAITLTGLDHTITIPGRTHIVCQPKKPGVPLQCDPVTDPPTTAMSQRCCRGRAAGRSPTSPATASPTSCTPGRGRGEPRESWSCPALPQAR